MWGFLVLSAMFCVATAFRSSLCARFGSRTHRLFSITSTTSSSSVLPPRSDSIITMKGGQRVQLTKEKRRFATIASVEEAEIVEEEDFMDIVADSVRKAAPLLIEGLRDSKKGWATVDQFLPAEWIEKLRAEAVGLYEDGSFEISKSSRFDPRSESLVTYDKHNVYAMQLNGGEDYYKGPRLHEYVVSTVKTVVPIISEAFPEAKLHPQLVSNKLAVCTGEGSAYDKHYDNAGYDDTRKITILLYMNKWRPEMGGQFRIFGEGDDVTDIEPIGGRMLAFWSDVCVHSVLASEAPGGPEDHRYALTLWLTTENPEYIVRDNETIKRHFG